MIISTERVCHWLILTYTWGGRIIDLEDWRGRWADDGGVCCEEDIL